MINVGLLPEDAGEEPVSRQDLQAWNLNVYRAAWQVLAEVHPVPPRSRILEIGCGQGVGLRYLSDQVNASFTGVDLSIVAALIARCTNLTVKPASRNALPFGNATFDVVVMIEALFVFAGWEQAILEVRRVLAEGGYLVTAEFTSMTIEAAHRAVARRAEDAGFRLVVLRDFSAAARRAVMQGESARASYVRHLPAPIAAPFRTILTLRDSERYAQWAEQRQSYYIAVLQAV